MSIQCLTALGRSLIALASVGFSVAAVPTLAETSPAALVRLEDAYGKLPLGFEVNQGQTDGHVRFLARGPGYTLSLSQNEAVLRLAKPPAFGKAALTSLSGPRQLAADRRTAGGMLGRFAVYWARDSELGQGTSKAIADWVVPHPDLLFPGDSGCAPKGGCQALAQTCQPAQEQARTETVLRVRLEGANPKPAIAGRDRLPGTVNYLVAKDPRGWRTGIETYAQVAYAQVYPGIDLIYYGKQRQLEHDFIVAPGADPARIRLAFEGAKFLSLDADGSLVIDTGEGQVSMHKPVIYQEIAGVRKPIDGSYAILDGNRVGFRLAAYDTERPLVIDPVLVYSTYLGGTFTDIGYSIAVDHLGQAYVTGATWWYTIWGASSDFPTHEALQPAFCGDSYSDAFVTVFTADGRALRYSTYLGGSGEDWGWDIAVDSLGQAYVTGHTTSSDFPIHNAAQTAFGGGNRDAFVAAFTADGRALRYSTYLGGTLEEIGTGIAVDGSGRAYVTGYTASPDFPTYNALQPELDSDGGLDPNGSPYPDAFVAGLSDDGRALRYSTYLGGSDIEEGLGIATDSLGQAYVTGMTYSSDFPTYQALLADHAGGWSDAFITVFTANGQALRYSTYLGGSGYEGGRGVAVDGLGRAYVTGETDSLDFPTRNALQPTQASPADAFVAALTADGQALRYSTYLGGTGNDAGWSIAADSLGQVYLTGMTYSSDFPTRNALQPTQASPDYADAFVAALTADGQALRYSTYLGGSGFGFDVGTGIATDDAGQVYVTGYTNASDFPTRNALQPNQASVVGVDDAFVAKISSVATPSITFGSFHVHRLRIDCHHVAFSLDAHFALGKGSDGLNPPKEKLTLKVGKFATSIPVGSFRSDKHGRFSFFGKIGKLWVKAFVVPHGSNRYEFEMHVHGADLGTASTLMPVALAIGNDAGKATAKPVPEHCHHHHKADRETD